MTTNLITDSPAEEKKARPPSVFAAKGLTEPLRSIGGLDKLRESMLSLTGRGFSPGAFSEGITSATTIRVGGGPALLLETGSGSYLLYREPFEGFHMIVSGLLGKRPDESQILEKKNGERMFLAPVPPEKRSALDIPQG